MEKTQEQRIKALAGNWKRFECFVWYEQPEDEEQWSIVYTSNRDSDLLTQSNASAIKELMQEHVDSGDAREESHNHWACGYVEGYAIKCYGEDGAPTDAILQWLDIEDRLDNYPVLNEDDYSQRQYDASLDGIEQSARFDGHIDTDRLDKKYSQWKQDVYRALPDDEKEDADNHWPTPEAIVTALREVYPKIRIYRR